jgi:hypothetical protein
LFHDLSLLKVDLSSFIENSFLLHKYHKTSSVSNNQAVSKRKRSDMRGLSCHDPKAQVHRNPIFSQKNPGCVVVIEPPEPSINRPIEKK